MDLQSFWESIQSLAGLLPDNEPIILLTRNLDSEMDDMKLWDRTKILTAENRIKLQDILRVSGVSSIDNEAIAGSSFSANHDDSDSDEGEDDRHGEYLEEVIQDTLDSEDAKFAERLSIEEQTDEDEDVKEDQMGKEKDEEQLQEKEKELKDEAKNEEDQDQIKDQNQERTRASKLFAMSTRSLKSTRSTLLQEASAAASSSHSSVMAGSRPAIHNKDEDEDGLVPEDVIQTHTLKSINFFFNTRYQLLICGFCNLGITLSGIPSHASKASVEVRVLDLITNRAKMETISHGGFKIGSSHTKKAEAFLKKITTELDGLGYRDILDIPGDEASNFRNNPRSRPKMGQKGPIKGLKVFDGYTCFACPQDIRGAALTDISLDGLHKSKDHMRGAYKSASIQTMLLNGRSYINWFPVALDLAQNLASDSAGLISESDILSTSQSNAPEILKEKKMHIIKSLKLKEADGLQKCLNWRAIAPVLLDLGVYALLESYSQSAQIMDLVELPRIHSKTVPLHLKRLWKIVSITHEEYSKEINHYNLSVRREITDCIPWRRHEPPNPFKAPKTCVAYPLFEIKLLWALLQFLNNKDNLSQSSKPIFNLSKDLNSILSKLDKTLKARIIDNDMAQKLVYQAFNLLYFPKNMTASAKDAYHYPVISFLVISCLKNKGTALISFAEMCMLANMLQFSIRLRGLHEIMQTFDDKNEKWFLSIFKPFCSKYLKEETLSPFSAVRDWIHLTSRASRNSPRPNRIEWISNDSLNLITPTSSTNLESSCITIEVPELKKYISQELDKLEDFIDKKILLGINIEKMEISPNFGILSDTGDETTVGFGLLSSSLATLDNSDSDKLYQAFYDQNYLGLKNYADSNSVTSNKVQVLNWLTDINYAYYYLYPLCHITQGLPGRGSEENLYQIINTSVSRRHIFLNNNLRTLEFRSNWFKGSLTQNVYRHITRVLPYRVARLLFIMVHLIRPIELCFVFDYIIPQSDDIRRTNAVIAYQEKLWASMGKAWDYKVMARALERWFQNGVQYPIKFRMYRHLAIALQRKYLSYISSEEESNDLAIAADHMAGHTPETSFLVYARTANDGIPSANQAKFIKIGRDWHKFLELETSPA